MTLIVQAMQCRCVMLKADNLHFVGKPQGMLLLPAGVVTNMAACRQGNVLEFFCVSGHMVKMRIINRNKNNPH